MYTYEWNFSFSENFAHTLNEWSLKKQRDQSIYYLTKYLNFRISQNGVLENFGYDFRVLFTQKFSTHIGLSQHINIWELHKGINVTSSDFESDFVLRNILKLGTLLLHILACNTITETYLLLFRGVLSPPLATVPILTPWKYPWRSVAISKVAGWSHQLY